MEKLNKIPISVLLPTFIVVFVVLATQVSGLGLDDSNGVMLAAVSFLYGILVSFAISNNQNKLSTVNSMLKVDEANMLSIYQLSKKFGDDVSHHIRHLIDQHLIDQIDYKLKDYRLSSPSFYRLHDYILSLNPQTATQETVHAEMFDSLSQMHSNRKQVETSISDNVSIYEWTSLYVLLGLFYALILNFNTGKAFSIIVCSVLASVATMLILILRDLNNLKWKAHKWIWEPLHDLFLALGLHPYYAEGVLEHDEARPPKGSIVRIAKYKHPYPDFRDKEIHTVHIE